MVPLFMNMKDNIRLMASWISYRYYYIPITYSNTLQLLLLLARNLSQRKITVLTLSQKWFQLNMVTSTGICAHAHLKFHGGENVY